MRNRARVSMVDRSNGSAPRRAYLLFVTALGASGWALLAATALGGLDLARDAPPAALAPFATFFVVIALARALAFRLVPENVLSLDSAYYVAAAVCLGSVTAGWLVATALTLDATVRLLVLRRRQTTLAQAIAYVTYFGGMTGALVTGLGWLWRVDGLAAGGADSQVAIIAAVGGVGTSLIAAHYGVQGIRYVLAGGPLWRYLRRIALPGAALEVSLLPLAVVVVLVYDPARPVGFALLSATYLLINFAFNRLSRTTRELGRRVEELEVLNTTARRLSASLQLPELVDAVARETAVAIPEADYLILAHRTGEGAAQTLVVDCFDSEGDNFERLRVPGEDGPTGWVLENGEVLAIDDLGESRFDVGSLRGPGIRSWMGVPIRMYGNVEGVLAVQSATQAAFSARHQRLLESIALQAAVAMQNARLYELAMVDGLTKLFVRRYFDARLDEEIERSRRYGAEFSVVMMDIDNFKQLNDTHGHTVGDRVLRGVAEIVRRQMRGVDTAARYGGEELAMILPRTELISAYSQAERIRSLIADFRVPVDDQVIGVTASFGIAGFPESEARDAEDLVRRADRALYRAKKTGKNRVELYWADAEDTGRSTIRSV